jgi:hemerythrin-like domain-containing protein
MTGQVARLLDEEHRGTLDLLGAAEQAFALARGDEPRDAALVRLAARLHEHVLQHVPRHFGFEEQVLFPRLVEAGEGDLCELLHEEHVAIEAVIAEIAPLAARAESLEPARFEALKRGVLELAERLRGHIEKETMGLLPLCDDHLAQDTDAELALAYASA